MAQVPVLNAPASNAQARTAAILGRGRLRGKCVALSSQAPGTVASGPGTTWTTRYPFTVGPVAMTDLVFDFDHWVVNVSTPGDTLVGHAGTFKAALEYNGVSYPLYFAGGVRTAAPDDGGSVSTIPLGITLPAGASYFVRTCYISASGNTSPANGLTGDGGTYASGDSADGTGALGSSLTSLRGPTASAATGVPVGGTTRTTVTIGDSINIGQGDTTLVNGGWIRRALASCVVLCLGMSGEKAGGYLTQVRRAALAIGHDNCIETYGRNDFTASVTHATTAGYRVSIWRQMFARGSRVFASTITPLSTSSDSWVTTTNQTVSTGNAERILHNNWLRAGAPLDPTTLAPVAIGTSGAITATVYNGAGAVVSTGNSANHPLYGGGVLDPVANVESSLNSGIWAAPSGAAMTADGTHPNSAAYTLMANALPASLVTAA